jgi:hypothetical protein
VKRDGDAPRRPYENRDSDGSRPPYVKRDGGASRKPYEKRDGDASRKPYEKRDGSSSRAPYVKRDGDAPRRPYENRDNGGSRPPYVKRDGDASRKPYEKRDGDAPRRPYEKRDSGGSRPPYAKRDGDASRKPYENRNSGGSRPPYVKRDGDAPRRPYEKRDSGGSRPPYERREGNAGRPAYNRSDAPSRDRDRDRDVEPRIPDPFLPDDVTARDLHPSARNELRTLSKENADTVGRHLAMAVRLIDEDPPLAHEHALAASRKAGRVAVVRESLAITAYAVGDFALALRELRTYRRISGRDDQIAMMVDSERGVGRPDRALEVGRAVDRDSLPIETRVELAVAMSGARLDLGDPERALRELDIPELDPDTAFPWSPGLFAARAIVLEELGRRDEAARWTKLAEVAEAALDGDGSDDVLEIDEVEELDIDLDVEAADADDADQPAEPAEQPAEPSEPAEGEESDTTEASD